MATVAAKYGCANAAPAGGFGIVNTDVRVARSITRLPSGASLKARAVGADRSVDCFAGARSATQSSHPPVRWRRHKEVRTAREVRKPQSVEAALQLHKFNIQRDTFAN